MEDKIKTPVFQVGDQVTYKNRTDCFHRDGEKGSYYKGGDNHRGHVGTVTRILEYQDLKQCFCIHVTSKKPYPYEMLESEFVEYDDSISEKVNQYDKFVVKESIAETTTNPCNEVSLPTTMNDWERKFYEKFQCNHQYIKDFIQFLGEDDCLKFIELYDANFSNLISTKYFKVTPPESWLTHAFDWEDEEDWEYWDILDSKWYNFLDNEYSIDIALCLPGDSFLPLPSEQLQSCTLEVKEIPQPIQQQKSNNKLQFKF